jgi:hypothetical protein
VRVVSVCVVLCHSQKKLYLCRYRNVAQSYSLLVKCRTCFLKMFFYLFVFVLIHCSILYLRDIAYIYDLVSNYILVYNSESSISSKI